jgi:hypothetical protein
MPPHRCQNWLALGLEPLGDPDSVRQGHAALTELISQRDQLTIGHPSGQFDTPETHIWRGNSFS